jgi:methylated-DNA-[protein]-cysteine S-methyltransferase
MPEVLELLLDRIDTPIGELILVADHAAKLRAIDWTGYEPRMLRLLQLHYGKNGYRLETHRNPGGLSDTLASYFAGDVDAIDSIAVQTAGTPFQRSVWGELRRIPCGDVISYATLAQRIARPSAVRAVGHANGSNPVAIVVPCHRVVGSNGSLTGYAGGLSRKHWLNEHELKHGKQAKSVQVASAFQFANAAANGRA